MLEDLYLVAGIIGVAAAVVGLFLKGRSGKSTTINQKARVSGQGNTVQQSAENRSGDS